MPTARMSRAPGRCPRRAEGFHRRATRIACRPSTAISAKMALQRGLVTALKSRRQVADDLKGWWARMTATHSFNGIGMNQYLAAVRAKRVLKSKSDAKVGHRGGLRRNLRWPSAAGQDRRREHVGSAAPGALRQCGEGGGAAHRQSGRQRIRVRGNPARSAGAAQSRQTSGRVHEQLCGFRRLLHRRGREPNIRQSDDHHRIDRRIFLYPDVSAHLGETRRQSRRHRHDTAGRRHALRPAHWVR